MVKKKTKSNRTTSSSKKTIKKSSKKTSKTKNNKINNSQNKKGSNKSANKKKTASKKITKSQKEQTNKTKKTKPEIKKVAEMEVTEETNIHFEKRWCAALSYIIVGVIWYFVDDRMKKDLFVKFHAKQGLVLILSIITLQVLSSLVIFLTILWIIIGIFLLILGLIGIIYALEDKEKPIPLIGKYAKMFTF